MIYLIALASIAIGLIVGWALWRVPQKSSPIVIRTWIDPRAWN